MEAAHDRHGMFTCSATFSDILIIGEQLRVCMHSAPNGLVRDQRYLFRWHSHTFSGLDAVSWLVKTRQAAERFIAVALMNLLCEHNIIRNVTGAGGFKDDSNLYRFRKDDGTYDFNDETAVFMRGFSLCKRMSTDVPARKMFRTRIQNQVSFTHCVPGCELVDWMVQRQEARSREEAVRELNSLLSAGILRHVTDSQTFRDDLALYQFRTEFGRERILLDLILPPPQPEFGGAITDEGHINNSCTTIKASNSSGNFVTDNNNSEVQEVRSVSSHNSLPTLTVNHVAQDIPESKVDRVTTERTESGYHSDHLDTQSQSSLSESPMFDMLETGRKEKASPFSGGLLIRKASIQELEDGNSPYIKKFIRIVSDPVGYGFVIRGEGPVFVKTLDPMSPAAAAGLKVGHYIYSVNDQKVLDVHHRDLAHIILGSNGYITLVVMEHVRDSR